MPDTRAEFIALPEVRWNSPPLARFKEMADVIEKIINVYVEQRTEDEQFLDTFRRIGIDPFKERVYAANH